MINRETAVAFLCGLSGSPLLSDDVCDSLNEIANCIDAEQHGLHIWNADDDHGKLFVAYREDLLTDELKAELQKIADKYSFTPSPFEKEQEE